MNVYEKLHAARMEFHKAKIKKSGYNKFANYWFFELADFVMPILELFNKHKLFSHVTFDADYAYLRIIDMENPGETITFKSPMAGAELKGTHPIQQMGAVETYQRRYLYIMALDIVEHDAIDSVPPVGDSNAEDRMREAATLKELQAIFADAYRAASDHEKASVKAVYDEEKKRFEG